MTKIPLKHLIPSFKLKQTRWNIQRLLYELKGTNINNKDDVLVFGDDKVDYPTSRASYRVKTAKG